MKRSELSAEDQAILDTKFPEAFEKAAAAEMQLATEMYTHGFEKLAAESADHLDKLAEEEKEEEKEKEKEHKLDEEGEKKAAEVGAFIERGYFDGLRKLGSERHNDEWHYFHPAVQEKVASMKEKAMAAGGKAVAAVKGYHARGAAHMAAAAKGGKGAAAHAAKGAAHFAPHAAAAAGGAHFLLKGKKKEAQ